MRTTKRKIFIRALLTVLLFLLPAVHSLAAKKAKLRMTVNYVNEIGQGAYIDVKTRAKGEEGMASVANVSIKYYVFTEDTSVLIADFITDAEGMARIPIDLEKVKLDTSGLVQLEFKAKGSDAYKAASKSLEIRDCVLNADIDKSEDGYELNVELLDKHSGEPAVEEAVFFGVSRLFKPLPIEEGTYYTEEDGTVFVSFEDSIPSIDGNLEYVVKIVDSELYGTVILRIVKPFGYISERDDMFEERTMWSPPNKTPIFLLIFPNLIILGVWSVIVIQLVNLNKIRRSNN